MILAGLEYHLSEEGFKRKKGYAYFNPNADVNWHDKRTIRVFNHNTNEHYYLENVWPSIGDSNLLFIDFPRTDSPIGSWSSDSSQTCKPVVWAREELKGEFVRFKIHEIDKDNYCRVDDSYNKPFGWYARSCFYKITKKLKA